MLLEAACPRVSVWCGPGANSPSRALTSCADRVTARTARSMPPWRARAHAHFCTAGDTAVQVVLDRRMSFQFVLQSQARLRQSSSMGTVCDREMDMRCIGRRLRRGRLHGGCGDGLTEGQWVCLFICFFRYVCYITIGGAIFYVNEGPWWYVLGC